MLRFAEYGVIASILQIKYTLVYLRNRLLRALGPVAKLLIYGLFQKG